jgi:hypothetical protein
MVCITTVDENPAIRPEHGNHRIGGEFVVHEILIRRAEKDPICEEVSKIEYVCKCRHQK